MAGVREQLKEEKICISVSQLVSLVLQLFRAILHHGMANSLMILLVLPELVSQKLQINNPHRSKLWKSQHDWALRRQPTTILGTSRKELLCCKDNYATLGRAQLSDSQRVGN
jgi:hypothetical protein